MLPGFFIDIQENRGMLELINDISGDVTMHASYTRKHICFIFQKLTWLLKSLLNFGWIIIN